MNDKKSTEILEIFAQGCSQCAICLSACSLLDDLGLTPCEIAQNILDDQISDELVTAIQRCDTCGRCGQDCPVDLTPMDLIKAAREVLIQNGRIDPEDYDVMLVDREWNFFSIYQETYGICYDDLQTLNYDTLFFPGCTLRCYSPELTRAVFSWLKDQGLNVGFTNLCCGKPLDSIGLKSQAQSYLDRLRREIDCNGVHQIVTTCPNCEQQLRACLPGIEIRSINGLLVKAGIQLKGAETLTFHDSCPDRDQRQNLMNVRKLFEGYRQIEMMSHGKDTLCCGSGGIVSMINPDLCTTRAERRLKEFSASGADICITSCMACAHRLQRPGGADQVRHCLEYLFDIQVDYGQIERNIDAMWEGDQGEINLERLAQTGMKPV